MLMIVMVGIAATVILSTQQDLSVAGQDREQLQAFYAAEYAVAQAKDYLQKQVPVATVGNFTLTGGWTTVLQTVNAAGVPQGCASGPSGLPATPLSPRMGWQEYNKANGAVEPFQIPATGTSNNHVMWRYCIHNNNDDIAYLDTTGNAAATNATASSSGCGGLTADNCDWRDPVHYVTIEAWGAFPVDATTKLPVQGAAVAHLAANIGPPTPRTLIPLANDYSQEGASGSHNNNGGGIDSTAIDTTVVR